MLPGLPLTSNGTMGSVPVVGVNGQPVMSTTTLPANYLTNPPSTMQYATGLPGAQPYTLPLSTNGMDYSMMGTMNMATALPGLPGSGVNAGLAGYTYPLSYTYMPTTSGNPGVTDGTRPFDVPVSKPKRKHSKKAPGSGAVVEGGLDYSSQPLGDLSMYGVGPTGVGLTGTNSNMYLSYPANGMYMMGGTSNGVPTSTPTSSLSGAGMMYSGATSTLDNNGVPTMSTGMVGSMPPLNSSVLFNPALNTLTPGNNNYGVDAQ